MKHTLFTPLAAATLLCGCIGTSCNNTPTSQDNAANSIEGLNTYFDSIAPRHMCSIKITKGDSVIFSRNQGYANIEDQTPITDTTCFKIGSISKSFTAILTLKAVEAGKLTLDDKLIKFFPDANIPNADRITIYQMLHHRSGLCDYLNDVNMEDVLKWINQPQTHKQMIEIVASGKPNFEPGEQFRYSNSGYLLLGYILEQVYGKTYAELIDEQIVKPLGLRHTFCSSVKEIDSRSYYFDEKWVKANTFDPSASIGAGSIISTTNDLQKYAYALGSGFFGKNILDQMTDFVDGYGCGIFGESKTDFGHSGKNEEYYSYMHYNNGVVTTTLTNGSDINYGAINWSIENALKGETYYIPSLNFISLDSTKLNEYVGEFSCDSLNLKFSNDGKYLVMENNTGYKCKLEAKPNNLFQNTKFDIDVFFKSTKDSLKFRQGGQNLILGKVK